MRKIISLNIIAVFLFGCATIVEGDDQSMLVNTPNCPAAQCKLTNEQGSYFISSTPASVIVNKSTSPIIVECEKNGQKQAISVESGTEGMSFGNIIAGGIIGAGVDMASGAAYIYPHEINHPLQCQIN